MGKKRSIRWKLSFWASLSLIAVAGIVLTYFPSIALLQGNLPFLSTSLIGDTHVIGRFCILLAGFGATLGWVCSYLVVARFMHAVTRPE